MGTLAYAIFGLMLHCAHIYDGIARNTRSGNEAAWRQFLSRQAHKGIKDASKELTEALENGESSAVTALAASTPFDVRRELLQRHCAMVNTGSSWNLHISRETLFEDITGNLRAVDEDQVYYKYIRVNFIGERGQDAGGLTRDMFTLFGQQLGQWGTDTKPMKRLFKTAGEGAEYAV